MRTYHIINSNYNEQHNTHTDNMISSRCLTLLAVAFLALQHLSSANLIINNGSFALDPITTAQYFYKGDDGTFFEDVSGVLAHASMQDLQGKIVFQPFMAVRDWLGRIKTIQDAGAIAILYGTDSLEPGQYGCALASAVPLGEIQIPVAEINQAAFAQISQAILNGTIIEATLTSEGNNWNNILGGLPTVIVFRALYTATAVGLIGFALYKLIGFIRIQKPQFNVPQVCLALEIIANLLRIAYFAVDPFACFGSFGTALSFMTSLSFPFEVSTFVLITFYWYEAVTNASLEVYPFLARFKPFFFVFSILFIGAIILVIGLGFAFGFDPTTPLIIIYLIVSLAFLIFYSVTVGKIVKKMKRSNNLRQKKTKLVNDVNQKIILNGIIRVLSLIPIIVFIVPVIATVALGNFVGSVFIYAMIMLDSWSRIYLFKVPKRTSSTSSVKSSTSRDTANDTITLDTTNVA